MTTRDRNTLRRPEAGLVRRRDFRMRDLGVDRMAWHQRSCEDCGGSFGCRRCGFRYGWCTGHAWNKGRCAVGCVGNYCDACCVRERRRARS